LGLDSKKMKRLKLNKKILGLIALIFCLSFCKISIIKSDNSSQQVEIPNPVGYNTFQELLIAVLVFLQVVGAVISIFSLIAAGFKFITAEGDPEKVKQGFKMVFWTVVGLFIIISSIAFIEFLKETVFKSEK
jgi:hypothetical protein